MKSRPQSVLCLLLLLSLLSCTRSSSASGDGDAKLQPASNASAEPSPITAAPSSADTAPKPDVNGNHVMQYVKDVVAFGARPPGSTAHLKLENYILSKLKGVEVEQDRFTAQTPVGKFPMNNIIAKFPGKRDGVIVVAGHYDTLYNQPKFVGANDGGSSTAILLAIADQLRGKQLDGYSVWLLWTDGEEAFVHWTATDSVYGSRQLAQKWQQNGTAKKVKAFILADMVGDSDLDILKDMNSTPWLSEWVYRAASNVGYQSHFYGFQNAIDDDHMPFARVGIPVVDLIDFTYGYNNALWHTPDDTVDKLSPQSLAITTDVVLEAIRLVNAK